VVEATFVLNQDKFEALFNELDVDFDQETIIRREITKAGKSRAFINDTPVQLTALKSLSEQLISIHSQYNTLDLKRREFQMQTLDVLAGTKAEQLIFAQEFNSLKSIEKEIESKRETLTLLLKEKDYKQFQLNELEELNLSNTNFNDIEERLNRIENTSEILQLSSGISNAISSEMGVLDQLHAIKQAASKLTKLAPSNQPLEERIQSVIIELKDIDNEYSSLEIEQLNEQEQIELTKLLDRYNDILTKHRCQSQDELVQLFENLSQEQASTDLLEEELNQLEKQHTIQFKKLQELALQLHTNRLNAIGSISENLQKSLDELKLPDTKLVFSLTKEEKLSQFGITQLELLFSANKGIPPTPIEKAASGGELSRVMLALQKLISEKVELPTIFFDEIDTGVSGDVAQKMGKLLQEMGDNMQLFAISHLPQVAAKASHHLKVIKTTENELTQTTIVALDMEQRVEEVARLMSGEVISEGAIANAKALMQG
ncbi:MAG TPA: hypothetical protein VKZ44_10190, partial [Taishania sp.]|nr:hypothetical protein [Taishania sp.]